MSGSDAVFSKKGKVGVIDVIGTKIFIVFLLAFHGHLFYASPHPLQQKWFEIGL
jgi:hypothetical protein